MNSELPDITNALGLNNTLRSYVINLMREKSLSFNILIFLREKNGPNQENELECWHKRKNVWAMEEVLDRNMFVSSCVMYFAREAWPFQS